MSLAERVDDLRWALDMMRVRRYRRKMLFSQRLRFDAALRPKMDGMNETVIAYPDAFYHASIDDIARAYRAALRKK